MEEVPKASDFRYVGMDIHKHYCVVAGVDRDGQVVFQPVRVEHENLEGWLKKNLDYSDHVEIEATTNAWHVYDLLEPIVAEVQVANPIKVKQIGCARVKTDKKDTLILARLLAANLVPTVWVPPQHVRELRQLISQRRRLVGMHTQVVNRMHSVSHRHHLGHPRGKRFQEKDMKWREKLDGLERFQLDLDLETKKYLKGQIERITEELRRMSHEEPWARQMLYLLTPVWYVLIRQEPYAHYSTERIAYKYYTWSWQLNEAQRKGLTRPQFVRYYLMRLGIGSELQRVALDPKHPHGLASEAEILALMPDLKPPG